MAFIRWFAEHSTLEIPILPNVAPIPTTKTTSFLKTLQADSWKAVVETLRDEVSR